MKFVVFGLSISSSWGNGHATLWRGLCAALARLGHSVTFFERDVHYYAAHRDYVEIPMGRLVLYQEWQDVVCEAKRELEDADIAMVTSYCPDGVAASELLFESNAKVRSFYDLDAPITLSRISAGLPVSYIGADGLREFDVVLSYTGGAAINGLKTVLGARKVATLYGSVDPSVHYPAPAKDCYRGDLSYLGTHSADRDTALRTLFFTPSERSPSARFVLGGSQYDPDFPWCDNIQFCSHVPVAEHPAFYCSARLTLNVTRQPMAQAGFCPSARLFEATACGVPVITDAWEGLDRFFEPGSEILVANGTEDVLAALEKTPEELRSIARAGRDRTLSHHTADIRAQELLAICDGALSASTACSQVI